MSHLDVKEKFNFIYEKNFERFWFSLYFRLKRI